MNNAAHLLSMYWPVERLEEASLPEGFETLVGLKLAYVESIGHGWNRLGLTLEGRTLAAKRAARGVAS